MTTLQASVDRDIVDHRIMFALKTIREVLSCTIHEAIDVFAVRYEEFTVIVRTTLVSGPRSTSGPSTPDRRRTGLEDQVSGLENRRGAGHRGFKSHTHRPAQRPLTWWIGRAPSACRRTVIARCSP
ncbi:hypothetical protein AB0919_41730 [Streptomyces sp. NPDC046994]|uniref:hypothetical protein n=1 Tax=Streptomyces sp. NPDC046994 TaxID=3155735 RepID=UPI0034573285